KLTTSMFAASFLPLENFAVPFAEPNAGPVLRVALMGLGQYATRVAEAMRACKKAKVVGLVSGTPAKIDAWQPRYHIPLKNCYNYENFDKIVENPDIDAVYVLTPNGLLKEHT